MARDSCILGMPNEREWKWRRQGIESDRMPRKGKSRIVEQATRWEEWKRMEGNGNTHSQARDREHPTKFNFKFNDGNG